MSDLFYFILPHPKADFTQSKFYQEARNKNTLNITMQWYYQLLTDLQTFSISTEIQFG